MSSKYAAVVVVLMAAILLTGSGRDSAQADETLVSDIQLNPDPAIVNETLEISCKVSDETNVKTLWMNLCSAGNCFLPEEMEKGTDDVWRVETAKVLDLSEHYFSIAIEYDNGSWVYNENTYFTPQEAPSKELETESIEHAPSEVIVDEEVDIYTKLANETGVSEVVLQHCLGTSCFTPVTMTRLDNGSYHARIGPFDTTDEIKYNVTVTYSSGHKAWTQDFKFTPQAKMDGDDDGDDDGGLLPAMGAVAVIAILAGLAVSSRRSRKE
jgi:hypothetical protein